MSQYNNNRNVPSTTNSENKVEVSSISDFQRKVKFTDKDVRVIVNKIINTIDSAVYYSNADIIDTLRFLQGATLEVAIQYNPVPAGSLIRVSPGDVVECKFGTHMDGEISGMSVHSIVCDIQDDGTVYLLPITKKILDGDARKFMLIRAPHDVSYYNPKLTGGTILLRMGKYVRPERIRIVVGKTSPEFFKNVLRAFHDSMDFSGNVPKKDVYCGSNEATPVNSIETPEVSAPTSSATTADGQQTETADVPEAEVTPKKAPKKPREKKVPFEDYMQTYLEPILENINDPDFGIEDKVALFLSELKFEDKLGLVHDAFVVSCEVPRVTITSIIAALSKIHRRSDKETIKTALAVSYEQWLSQQHPEILEKYQGTSIMTMLKVFSKKMK